MTNTKKNTLAIIPARGGSKRIPRKNIKQFFGQPIIKYSIDAAFASNCFDEVMVSTDDHEIAETAVQYGALVPFFRSLENSGDHVQIANVALEVLDWYENHGRTFHHFCCILPTVPFITPERIAEGYALLQEKQAEAIFPVLRFSYPIERALHTKEGRLKMRWPKNYDVGSQHFPAAFHDAGQFYWLHVPSFRRQKRFFLNKSYAIELTEAEAHDIDNPEDWQTAEIKYKLLHNLVS